MLEEHYMSSIKQTRYQFQKGKNEREKLTFSCGKAVFDGVAYDATLQ